MPTLLRSLGAPDSLRFGHHGGILHTYRPSEAIALHLLESRVG